MLPSAVMRKDSMRCGTRGENLVLYFPSPSFLVKASFLFFRCCLSWLNTVFARSAVLCKSQRGFSKTKQIVKYV